MLSVPSQTRVRDLCHEDNGTIETSPPPTTTAESKGKTSPCSTGVLFHKLNNVGFIAEALQHVLCTFMAYHTPVLKSWTGLNPLSYHSGFNNTIKHLTQASKVYVFVDELRVNYVGEERKRVNI